MTNPKQRSYRLSGVIGRRAWFRSKWSNPWRFKSSLKYFIHPIMKINLWYSTIQKQWRWSLCDDTEKMRQESGSQPFLRDAMEDIANTVEYMLKCKQPE